MEELKNLSDLASHIDTNISFEIITDKSQHGIRKIGFTSETLDRYVEKTNLEIFKTEQPYLSICYIVKNEPESLESSLKTAVRYNAEVLVLDTSDTAEYWEQIDAICFDYKVRYLYTKFENFSQARNLVKKQAKGKFILMLDADEDFQGDVAELINLLTTTEAEAFQTVIKNYSQVDGKPVYSFGTHIRLFRNRAEYEYSGYVHEDILQSILQSGIDFQKKLAMLDNFMIIHYGYFDPATQPKKFERNFELLSKEIHEKPSANAYFRRSLLNKDYFKNIAAAEMDIKSAILYTSNPNFDELGLKVQILNLGAVISMEIGAGQDVYNRANSSLEVTKSQVLPKVILGDLALTIGKKDIAKNLYLDALNSYDKLMGEELYPIPPEQIQEKLNKYCGNIIQLN